MRCFQFIAGASNPILQIATVIFKIYVYSIYFSVLPSLIRVDLHVCSRVRTNTICFLNEHIRIKLSLMNLLIPHQCKKFLYIWLRIRPFRKLHLLLGTTPYLFRAHGLC